MTVRKVKFDQLKPGPRGLIATSLSILLAAFLFGNQASAHPPLSMDPDDLLGNSTETISWCQQGVGTGVGAIIEEDKLRGVGKGVGRFEASMGGARGIGGAKINEDKEPIFIECDDQLNTYKQPGHEVTNKT